MAITVIVITNGVYWHKQLLTALRCSRQLRHPRLDCHKHRFRWLLCCGLVEECSASMYVLNEVSCSHSELQSVLTTLAVSGSWAECVSKLNRRGHLRLMKATQPSARGTVLRSCPFLHCTRVRACRYSRNDELGIPYAITFDFDTMEESAPPSNMSTDPGMLRLCMLACHEICFRLSLCKRAAQRCLSAVGQECPVYRGLNSTCR